MKIKLFNRKKRERPDVEDMIWAIKMLTMSEEEIKKIIKNFCNAIKYYEKT